jgi:hypothetical protein
MWHVQVSKAARTAESHLTEFTGFGMQVAQADTTFGAYLQ